MGNSELNDALPILSKIDYSDVPKDNLAKYMKDVFKGAETIINSVPSPPASGTRPPLPSTANTAKKLEDTVYPPYPDNEIDARNADIQSAWGKHIKSPAKDNPLNITVYKMSGHDKHGAWFARRSIHQNLGFTKWKKLMQREFGESLAQIGGAGTGAIRGIAADKRLEKEDVEGVGKIEAYQLSAIFGPVTAREFVALIHTSDNALGEASVLKSTGKPPRHYIVVSRPTSHPEAPAREKHVMGAYESIEMIRELPIAREGADPETNPVDWIMITRSDPGGGIPRFMVEKGTPNGVVEDTGKFIAWALSQPEPSDDDVQAQEKQDEVAAEAAKQQQEQEPVGVLPTPQQTQPSAQTTQVNQSQSGILGTISGYTEAAVASYAPSYLPTVQHALGTDVPEEESDDDSDSSLGGYVSAEDDLPAGRNAPLALRDRTATMTSNASGVSESQRSLAAELENGTAAPTNHNEKNVVKLAQKRSELDDKNAKIKAEYEQKSKELEVRDAQSASKEQQKLEKEKQKQEAKYQKELEKLDKKQKKEAAKVEERRAKALSKDELQQTKTERDDYKNKLGTAEKEIESLKQQIADFQRRLGNGQTIDGEGEEHLRQRAATMPVQDNHIPGTTRYIG